VPSAAIFLAPPFRTLPNIGLYTTVIPSRRIEYRRLSFVMRDGKKIKVCERCTNLINHTFQVTHHEVGHFKTVADLSTSAKSCPVCRFMLHHVALDPDATLDIDVSNCRPGQFPAHWAVRTNNDPPVYFLPTQDGALMQARPYEASYWIHHPLYLAGTKYDLACRWLKACLKHSKCRAYRASAPKRPA
jgi:hypothetical protein